MPGRPQPACPRHISPAPPGLPFSRDPHIPQGHGGDTMTLGRSSAAPGRAGLEPGAPPPAAPGRGRAEGSLLLGPRESGRGPAAPTVPVPDTLLSFLGRGSTEPAAPAARTPGHSPGAALPALPAPGPAVQSESAAWAGLGCPGWGPAGPGRGLGAACGAGGSYCLRLCPCPQSRP